MIKTARLLVALTACATASPVFAQTTLGDAQRLFYNGRYEAANTLTAQLCSPDLAGLESCELLSSTLLFQIKRGIKNGLKSHADKQDPLAVCSSCADWMSEFNAVTMSAQAVARVRLQAAPDDEATRFLLGKVDLNYVWLQLGVLGRKTGWGEYWEGRRALDAVLKQNPNNVRARVSRAWIDYIVDTQMPRGTRWVLGGGNKKRGLKTVREAADFNGDVFVRAEAGFALWDMQVREGETAGAVQTARGLSHDFPDNEELRRFLMVHEYGN